MLSTSPLRQLQSPPTRQQGVVLLIALIILVALTLAGVALIRSVDTTNLIAGNMSFSQAAVHAGEKSTELAITNWLGPNAVAGDVDLHGSNSGQAYIANRADPAANVSWDTYWNSTLGALSKTLPVDAAGNTVSYVIHRLCDTVGPPQVANCAKPPSSNTGGTQSAGGGPAITRSQVYYRITTRIAGPRNTVAYIQTIVAL